MSEPSTADEIDALIARVSRGEDPAPLNALAARVADPRAAAAIIAALDHDDFLVCRTASDWVRQLGLSEAIPTLLRVARRPAREEAWVSCGDAIGSFGREHVAELIDACGSAACRGAARAGGEVATAFLLRVLVDEGRNKYHREDAINGLRDCDDPRVIPALAQVLSSQAVAIEPLALIAARILRKRGALATGALLAAWTGPGAPDAGRIVALLADLRDPIAEPILRSALAVDACRQAAEKGLALLGDAGAIAAIIDSLTADRGPRVGDAIDIGGAGLPLLEPLLAHAAWRARQRVAIVLGEIADGRAVPAIVAALERETHVDTRISLALAVARCGQAGMEAIGAMIAGAARASADVRYATAYALGYAGKTVPIEMLATLLADEVAGVREAAVRAIALLRAPIALEPLLDDSDEFVARAAAYALKGAGEGSARVGALAKVVPDSLCPICHRHGFLTSYEIVSVSDMDYVEHHACSLCGASFAVSKGSEIVGDRVYERQCSEIGGWLPASRITVR